MMHLGIRRKSRWDFVVSIRLQGAKRGPSKEVEAVNSVLLTGLVMRSGESGRRERLEMKVENA